MLETAHALAAAVIVSKIPNPIISLPIVVVSHYLLDAIPHWDSGTGLTTGKKTKKTAVIETLFDLAIAATAVFIFFQLGKSFSLKLWLAVGLSIFPDLIEAPALFCDYRPSIIAKLEKFHNRLHRRLKFPWGFLIQLPLIFALLLLSR